ncbi:MAG: T9SS type A sorting domain-containing protein, partial [Saprospiraceae bacterium]
QENYSVKDGKIRISWSSIEVTHISPGDILFSIELKSSSGGLLSQRISIADQLLKPEVYTKNLEVVGMHLIIKNTGNELSERNIFYVDPNPAKSTINLHFYLKDEGLVEFHCFDFTGRLLSAMVKNYSKGEQMEEIKVDGFPSGIIFCQILHNGITSVKMLIKTE